MGRFAGTQAETRILIKVIGMPKCDDTFVVRLGTRLWFSRKLGPRSSHIVGRHRVKS